MSVTVFQWNFIYKRSWQAGFGLWVIVCWPIVRGLNCSLIFPIGYLLENVFLPPLSVQFSSVTQLCLTLCDPMGCSMPGFPVHHQFPELTQTHVHRVGDAIQPSHPLLSPSPPAFNSSQHQGLFQWVSSSHQVASFSIKRVSASASVLPMNI